MSSTFETLAPAQGNGSDRNGLPVTAQRRAAPQQGTSGLLGTSQLTKSYRKGALTIPVLRDVNFAAEEGQFTSIVGQSGCGKSTLLHLLATLDTPRRAPARRRRGSGGRGRVHAAPGTFFLMRPAKNRLAANPSIGGKA